MAKACRFGGSPQGFIGCQMIYFFSIFDNVSESELQFDFLDDFLLDFEFYSINRTNIDFVPDFDIDFAFEFFI